MNPRPRSPTPISATRRLSRGAFPHVDRCGPRSMPPATPTLAALRNRRRLVRRAIVGPSKEHSPEIFSRTSVPTPPILAAPESALQINPLRFRVSLAVISSQRRPKPRHKKSCAGSSEENHGTAPALLLFNSSINVDRHGHLPQAPSSSNHHAHQSRCKKHQRARLGNRELEAVQDGGTLSV